MQPPESSSKVSRPDVGIRSLVMFAALVVVLAGLREAKDIILPVLLSGFLAVLSFPPIAWLHKKKLPLWAAVLVVFLGVIFAFGLVSVFITSSVADFTRNVSFYQQRIVAQIEPILTLGNRYGIEVSTSAITSQLSANQVMGTFASALTKLTSVLSDTLFVLLTTVFIIAEAAGLPAKIRVAMGNPDADLDRYSKVLSDLQSYLGIKTQVSLITGALAGLLCWTAGIDYPLLWALVAFLLNFVPTLGSILAAVPPVLLGLVQFGWQRALIVLASYLVINMVMGNVIEPRLMGRRLGLSTLVVFLSLVFWGFIWGPLGMLLCVPLTMLAKILLQNSDDLRWVAVLLGSGAELREQTETWKADTEANAAESVRGEPANQGGAWSDRTNDGSVPPKDESESEDDGTDSR